MEEEEKIVGVMERGSAAQVRLESDTPLCTNITLSIFTSTNGKTQLTSRANSQRDKEKKSLQFPDEMRCNHRNLWYSDDAIYNLKFYLKYNFQSKSDGSYEICKLSIAGMGIHCIWWRSGVTGSATVNVNNALFTLYPSYLAHAVPPPIVTMCQASKNPCWSCSKWWKGTVGMFAFWRSL